MNDELTPNDLPSYMTEDFATPDDKPTAWQAMLETENSTVSAFKLVEDMPEDFDVVDPEFDSLEAANSLEVPESQRVRLIASRNQREFDWRQRQYEREVVNQEVLSQLPMMKSFGLGLGATGLDPISWGMAVIPITRAATIGGKVAKGAMIGGLDASVTGAVLVNTQTERGLSDFMVDVGGGALFGSVLGAAAFRPEIREMMRSAKVKKAAEATVDDAGKSYTKTESTEGFNSAGAAEVRETNIYVDKEFQNDLYNKVERGEMSPREMNTIINNEAIKESEVVGGGITGPFRQMTPVTDFAHSPNPFVREYGDTVFESSILKQLHKDNRAVGPALDTDIDMYEGQYFIAQSDIMTEGYSGFVGTRHAALQVGKDVMAKFSPDDHMTLREWNEGLTEVFDNKGTLPDGLYTPDAKKALEETASALRAKKLEYEKDLVDSGTLNPGNYQQGVDLDKAAAKNDKEAFDLEEKRDRIFADIEKGQAEIAEKQAAFDAVQANFDPEKVQAYRQRTRSAEYQLRGVEKRIKKADSTKRRQLKSNFELRKKNSPLTVRVNKAKAAQKKIVSAKPKEAYSLVERDNLVRARMDKSGKSSTKQADKDRKERSRNRRKVKSARDKVSAYEVKLNKANANLEKAQPTPAELRKEGAELANLQRDYRDIPTPKEVNALRARRIDLKKQASETAPSDIKRERDYLLNRRTAKQDLNYTKKRVRTRVGKKADRLDRNQANLIDRMNTRADLEKQLDEFKYDPTHGDPQGGGWHYARIFKTRAVYENPDEFIDRAVNDWIDQLREIARDKATTPEEAMTALDAWKDARRGDGREALEKRAEGVLEKITSSHTGHVVPSISMPKRFKMERKFTVRNQALRGDKEKGEISFIETDMALVTKLHIRSMTPEMVMRNKGYNFQDHLNKVNKWYRAEIKRTPDAKGKKKLRKDQNRLTDKMVRSDKLIHNALGKPENPFSTLNSLRDQIMSWNVMRALGSMPVSALPDLGHMITRLGLASISGNLARVAFNPAARKMSKKAAQRMMLVTERTMASRMAQMTMTDDMAPGMSSMSRFMHKQANYFVTATGMNHWNQLLKEFAITSYSDEIMRTAIRLQGNPDALSTRKKAGFAAGGIDKDDWKGIFEMWDEFGEREGGLLIPMIDKWTNKPLKMKMMAILKKEADTAVVTPGKGDLPLWMRGPVGGMMGQFKSFAFASTNKILIPGVQKMRMGDPNALVGMMSQLMLGGAVYGLKMKLQGREIDTSWPTLIRESIDRSGYFGIYTDMNAMLEKVSRGNLGIAGIYKQFGVEAPELSRYYTRPIMGDILGPTSGTIEDMNRMVGSIFKGDATKGDMSAWRRMIPYQNMWYMRNGLNEVQEAANDRFVQ